MKDQRGGRSWEGMKEQERSALVAEWMGWRLVDETPHPEHRKPGEKTDLWYQDSGRMLHRIPASRDGRRRDPDLDFCPTLYLDDARLVEEEVMRRGLFGQYTHELLRVLDVLDTIEPDAQSVRFIVYQSVFRSLLRATADQKCLAALRAGGVGV